MRVACGSSSRGERLFFALWPDDEVRARVAAEARTSGGRPVAAGGYHMTLAFVGEADSRVRCALEQGAGSVRGEGFVCVLDRIEAWGPGIEVVAPSAPPAPLLALAEGLHRLVADVTGAAGCRSYRPHVTLTRHADHARSANLSLPIVWCAREYVLCRSVRAEPGRYDVLKRWLLDEDL